MNKRLVALSVLGLTAALVGTTHGFNLINPARKWFQGIGGGPNDLPVLFLVNQNGEESVNDSDNGVSAVRSAITEWNSEVSVTLAQTDTTSSNAVGNDGQNVTSFNDPAKIVRNAIAVTLVGFVNSSQTETVNGINFSRYLDTDTSFSKRLSFTTQAVGSCSGEYDIQAVETHEIGHALGLDHSASGAALMYPSVSACDFKRIGQDDHDGINTIYNPNFGGGNPCTPSKAVLGSLGCDAPAHGPNCLVVSVSVADDCGNGVSGAPVTVQLTGQEAGDVLTGSASTNGSGTVSFALRCNDAASSTYEVEVTAIGGSLSWSSNDNDNAQNPITCNTR